MATERVQRDTWHDGEVAIDEPEPAGGHLLPEINHVFAFVQVAVLASHRERPRPEPVLGPLHKDLGSRKIPHVPDVVVVQMRDDEVLAGSRPPPERPRGSLGGWE